MRRLIPRLPTAATAVLGCYLLDCAVHLAAQLGGWTFAARVTQLVAMPLLALALGLSNRRSRLISIAFIALGFSWLGDSMPGLADGDTAFLVLVTCFFIAQIAYIAAFWPYRRESVLTTWWVTPYVVAFAALVALCAPVAGVLLAPMIAYGLSLVAMAALSTGAHPMSGFGGALFLVSDALIALSTLQVVEFAHSGFVIMATYLVAQLLIVLGAIARTAREAPAATQGTVA